MHKEKNGLLIALEGIDGSGKSTLARALHALLLDSFNTNEPDIEKKREIILTKQPGGTKLGTELRELLHKRTSDYSPIAEYLLFAADRAQHAHELIMPALARGAIILCDRFSDSSLAYQGYGRNLDKTMIRTINAWALQDSKPDITLYCALNYDTCVQRITERNAEITAFEEEKRDYFERVIKGFEELYAGRTDVITLDASLPAQEVAKQAYEKIMHILVEKKC